uniref:Uncharacterized protein n=1 Tax=Salmo trutta TaxID=8032 RepID=A0A674C6U6_SALTR
MGKRMLKLQKRAISTEMSTVRRHHWAVLGDLSEQSHCEQQRASAELTSYPPTPSEEMMTRWHGGEGTRVASCLLASQAASTSVSCLKVLSPGL